MGESTASSVGRRIREIRTWRDVTQRATAELAGISPAYLSMIESGERVVERRAVLEAIARALRVSPVDLGAAPTSLPLDPDVAAALDRVPDLEAALTDVQLGEVTVAPREWAAVRADVVRLEEVLRPRAQLAEQMQLLPGLVRELNALHAAEAGPREEVLDALINVLHAAASKAKKLNVAALPALCAVRMREVAEELDQPRYHGLAAFGRVITATTGRVRTRELSLSAADALQGRSDDPERQVYGMLHLVAAMASAAQGAADDSHAHLREAREAVEAADDPRGSGWGGLNFTRTNLAFWEVALTLELDDAGAAVEAARDVRPEAMPSWERQAAYFVDLGRALAQHRERVPDAAQALLRAESLAAVQVRTNVWARETVTDLMRRTRRDDTTGRELRGLAYRMGLAA
jgi:transcriptional regulator with XRE-family HTH domain